jgi:hypothetical protein
MQEEGTAIQRPNSMNNYGVILENLGFAPFFDQVVQQLLPITSLVFAKEGCSTLDSHHAFTVDYEPEGDVQLGFHVDDAEITLNVCLGDFFTGGDVYFRGQRCQSHVNTKTLTTGQGYTSVSESYAYQNVPGMAIIHAGKNRHGVLPIEAGHRVNLIVWCRSSEYRRLQHECECLHYIYCSICQSQPEEEKNSSTISTMSRCGSQTINAPGWMDAYKML